jgi:hypothetical protein
MGIGIKKGAARRLRRTWGLVFWIVIGSITFVTCGRMLWLAYTTHSVFLPLRRARGRWMTLELDPLFFWSGVTIYVLVFLCGPWAVAAWIGDLIEEVRGRRNRARIAEQKVRSE